MLSDALGFSATTIHISDRAVPKPVATVECSLDTFMKIYAIEGRIGRSRYGLDAGGR